MKDFVIYRVPSLKKVGCTRNLKKSCRERYAGRRVIILEIIPGKRGPKYAGDAEWKWAMKFGYKRGKHYLNTWDFRLTKQQRSIFARRSPKLFTTRSGRKFGKWKGRKGIAAVDPKTAAKIAKKGAVANGQSPNNHFRQELTCPHCGLKGNGGNMQRWHFDNCRAAYLSIMRSTNAV